MVEPVARIRPVQLADQKLVRFMIGKAGMEPIATANRRSESSERLVAFRCSHSSPVSVHQPPGPRDMGRAVMRVRGIHELVAKT